MSSSSESHGTHEMSWFGRWVGKAAVNAAANAIKSGAFDDQIERVVIEQLRKGCDGHQLTRVGFILMMAVEMIDRSSPRLPFKAAKEMAYQAYDEFRLSNGGVKFGAPGWDWSAAGAKTLAEEYSIQYWEPTP